MMWAILLMPTSNAFFYAAPPPTICWVNKQKCFFSKTYCKATRRVWLAAVDVNTSRSSDHEQKRNNTAMLLLSPTRLRLRDNVALTKAAELGSEGLSICIVWPYTATNQLTPAEAFGYAAVRGLNDKLKALGQHLSLLPSYDDLPHVVNELKPSHVIVDTCLLDRHHNRASTLRDKLQATNVVEVVNGTLVEFENIAKVLGRSRKGGRVLRWSTFLSNTMKEELNIEKHLRPIPPLPPPLHNNMNEITRTLAILSAETFPSWAKQLLEDWGDVSEEEALLRAKSSGDHAKEREGETSFSSSLTEKGSKNTKLSPYLRWGIISPHRAAGAGVRLRDLLWRDWSHISYALLGPLQRGDAVMEFMDNTCRSSLHIQHVSETDLFNLWCVGNTGSKLVDAGMRQLWKEGWMPRRLRLLTAGCLVEGLGLDWRWGRDWFEKTLVDHDLAINEAMWQNAGLSGVDPFYAGIAWEQPPNGHEEDYVEKWSKELLIWPSSLAPYSSMEPPSQILNDAISRREVLRERGVYKAARTVSNTGVRVAWEGLATNASVSSGEVIGSGLVPVGELTI
jgi:deoxyribodipyrimidine photolyase